MKIPIQNEVLSSGDLVDNPLPGEIYEEIEEERNYRPVINEEREKQIRESMENWLK